jgi:hypothetical protein
MDTCESGAQYKTGYQERDRIVPEPKTFWIEPKTFWRWRSDSWVIGDSFRECGLCGREIEFLPVEKTCIERD